MTRTQRNRVLSVTALTLLAVAAVGGAQKLEVKSERDPEANFTAIRTYAWLPPAPMIKNVAPDAVSNPNLTDEVLGPHLVAAFDKQLAARGLSKVERDAADIHVVYLAALTAGVSQSFLGEHYGYITGWGAPMAPTLAPATSSMVHQKGTVVVDVVQRASNRAIWRGSVVTRINQESTLDKRIARINEAAERIFQKFPIKAKK